MDDTLDDFIAKYRHSYVWLALPSGDLLTMFTEYGKTNLTFSQPEIGNIKIGFDKAKQIIRTRFPRKGLYNLPDGYMVMFYRVPARQYKRSPCDNNSIMVIPGTDLRIPIQFNTISHCFNAVYPNKQKALDKINNGACSVALSDKFGISITGVKDRFDIWYYNNIVGGIVYNKVSIFYEPLRQEIIDFFGEDLVWKH